MTDTSEMGMPWGMARRMSPLALGREGDPSVDMPGGEEACRASTCAWVECWECVRCTPAMTLVVSVLALRASGGQGPTAAEARKADSPYAEVPQAEAFVVKGELVGQMAVCAE
jgi:hypothetical protein